jgi:hypothetical protein
LLYPPLSPWQEIYHIFWAGTDYKKLDINRIGFVEIDGKIVTKYNVKYNLKDFKLIKDSLMKHVNPTNFTMGNNQSIDIDIYIDKYDRVIKKTLRQSNETHQSNNKILITGYSIELEYNNFGKTFDITLY